MKVSRNAIVGRRKGTKGQEKKAGDKAIVVDTFLGKQ